MSNEAKEYKVEILTSFLYPGIVLKGDSYDQKGILICKGGEPYTKQMIADLMQHQTKKIFYTRPASLFKEETSAPIIKFKTMEKGVDIAMEIEKAVTAKAIIPEKAVNEIVDSFIDQISRSEGTILNLLDLKDYDQYTYSHSINVCLLSILFAKKLNYNEKGLKVVGIGSLLHDLGKQMIPKDIINKEFKLTKEEYEIIKKHPVYGYEIIRNQSNYGSLIQKIVLLHHERYTGKGYPFGFRGEQIGDISQIVSLADTFDAITTDRPYRLAKPYWYALNAIKNGSAISFAPRMVKSFIKDMPRFLTENEIFKIGCFVILNTREVGEVIDYKYPQSLKPVVNIYINSKKEVVRYPVPVNLEFDDSRFIENVLEDESIVGKLSEIRDRLTKRKETVPEAAPETQPVEVIAEEIPAEHPGNTPPPEELTTKSEDAPQVDNDLFVEDELELK